MSDRHVPELSSRTRFLLSLIVVAAFPLNAQESDQAPPPLITESCFPAPAPARSPFEGSLCERRFLLGDLFGVRTDLASQGIMVNASSTQFYQGVASGGAKQEFEYSGRMDYFVNVDGEKSGLWKGLFVTLHGETRYGEAVNLESGAIMPTNFSMLFPVSGGTETALTGVKFTQALSENFIAFAGKLNMQDDSNQPFAGGRGVDAFMNMGLASTPIASRTVPYSTLGAGFAVLHERQPVFSFLVLDTNNTPTTTGFERLFTDGAVIVARVNVPVTVLNRPGHQGFWGTYSSGRYFDLQPTPYFDPISGAIGITGGRDTGSWSLSYAADQALFVDPNNPKRSWGVFTNLGLADDGPSPVRWSANVGIGGSSPISSRPLDTFGLGYSYVNYSGPVQTAAPAILPITNDHVVELFYNYAVTPWFRITPDLQILLPARERTLPPGGQPVDTAIVLGLRAKLDF